MKKKIKAKKEKVVNEKIVFGVITEVPGDFDEGNVCDRFVEASEIRVDMSYPRGKCVHFPESFIIKDPVFVLGEILVLNDYGREIGGDGRKPGKWLVECEEFTNVQDAVRRSRKVDEDQDKAREEERLANSKRFNEENKI